jgi:uncharacterized protein YbjT (DUF2867 family)
MFFDWTAPGTHDQALKDVGAVYLISPSAGDDPAPLVIDFCRKAITAGVERLVLLSGSMLPEGGPRMGQVHSWLRVNAPEWAVLRPSWFMQNFTEGFYLGTILNEGVVYSGTGERRLGFIDAGDIAKSAFGTLTAATAPNRDLILTGPRALSYAEVAATITALSGRPVRHVSMPVDAFTKRLIAAGFSKGVARILAAMDGLMSKGVEDRTTDEVFQASGAHPSSFEAFAADVREIWIP